MIRSLTKSAQSDSAKGNRPKPRVLLADGSPAMLDFVSKMLADDYEVVGAVRDGRAVLREYPRLRPDVVLLSISLGDLSGIEVAQQLLDFAYDARIVLMTVEEEPDFVKSALGAGASAYVAKFRLGTDLLPAIRAALVGKVFVSPTLLYQPGMRERTEELRREIADIQDANRRYEISSHNRMTREAHENRRLRLVQIMQELEAIQKQAARQTAA